jgi:ribosome biogenesis GTPase A
MDADLQRAVQWYPGHMVRAMRKIGDYLKLIDVLVEVVDARVPRSGRNPILDRLAPRHPRLVVLDRADLADPAVTEQWLASYRAAGQEAVAINALDQRDSARVLAAVERIATRQGRAMVVGLPNSGKSSVINGLLRRTAAKTENRAGVTRQLQWFRLGPRFELMDTPGVLVPKIPTPAAQWKLALAGAVPRDRYDPQEVAGKFHAWAQAHGRTAPALATFARERGFLRRGGEIDFHNAAQSYISAFNEGTFGRISLESPGDDGEAA